MAGCYGSKNIKKSSMNLYIKENPFLIKNGDSTFCKVCQVSLKTLQSNGKGILVKHVNTVKHKENFLSWNKGGNEKKWVKIYI